jgi:uncharacterized protein YigA (DUF484 family)
VIICPFASFKHQFSSTLTGGWSRKIAAAMAGARLVSPSWQDVATDSQLALSTLHTSRIHLDTDLLGDKAAWLGKNGPFIDDV